MREDFHKEALSKRILNRCKRNFDSFAFVFLLVLVMAAMMDSTSAFVTRKHKYALRRLKHVSILHAKKPSMAQRRKNRAKRLQQHANPYSRLPPPKIRADHKDAGISKNEALQTTSSLEETDSKAKQLLRSQRESVKMLTLIRERVELLDELALVKALDDKGYIYIDNFLKSSDIVTKIELEGKSLFENELMQADMDAIGLGEYMTSIQGGQDQYKQCPRSIEFIVSTTKHFPGDHLDKTKTMANMRTFSRKSWLASVQLLTGKNESYSEPEAPWKPFRTVRIDDDDARRLSMIYFAVPEGWEYGGRLSFGDESGEVVEVHRDRLVIWKSDVPYRQQSWRGTDEMPLASCLELHLVK